MFETSKILQLLETYGVSELWHWLAAQPAAKNNAHRSNVARFHETGPDLIEALVGAIACGQHAALAGPRGCGKSYCIGEAIKLAEERGLIPASGFIKVQGNKELPRDYLIEDDIALKVRQESHNSAVVPERRSAPLLRFAKRHEESGLPVTKARDDDLVVCYGLRKDGEFLSKPMREDQRIVLFLDEVNRFSDGVLDSLLLLLEEGELVMEGRLYRLPIVVMMTMNPPGYDASARVLSPPLSARIGRQYRLLSPRLDVLTDLIAPQALKRFKKEMNTGVLDLDGVTLTPPDLELIRKAAFATLCCWGDPKLGGAGFEYLDLDTQTLLKDAAAGDIVLQGAMQALNELCHFGPDARALADWMIASTVAAANRARSMGHEVATVSEQDFLETTITTLSHKLQDNFSSATRPDNTKRKEEAIYAIAGIVLSSETVSEAILRDLERPAFLDDMAYGLMPGLRGSDLCELMQKALATQPAQVTRWSKTAELLNATDTILNGALNGKAMEDALLHGGVIEKEESSDGRVLRFGSVSDRKLAKSLIEWIKNEQKNGENNEGLNTVRKQLDVLTELDAHSQTVERQLGRFLIVQEEKLFSQFNEISDMLQHYELTSISRARLVILFDLLDNIWIRCERDGGTSTERAAETLAIWKEDEGGVVVRRFALDAVFRMSRHNKRGGGARYALAILRKEIL